MWKPMDHLHWLAREAPFSHCGFSSHQSFQCATNGAATRGHLSCLNGFVKFVHETSSLLLERGHGCFDCLNIETRDRLDSLVQSVNDRAEIDLGKILHHVEEIFHGLRRHAEAAKRHWRGEGVLDLVRRSLHKVHQCSHAFFNGFNGFRDETPKSLYRIERLTHIAAVQSLLEVRCIDLRDVIGRVLALELLCYLLGKLCEALDCRFDLAHGGFHSVDNLLQRLCACPSCICEAGDGVLDIATDSFEFAHHRVGIVAGAHRHSAAPGEGCWIFCGVLKLVLHVLELPLCAIDERTRPLFDCIQQLIKHVGQLLDLVHASFVKCVLHLFLDRLDRISRVSSWQVHDSRCREGRPKAMGRATSLQQRPSAT
mmetsp:Transcript_58884/g.149164  ORF Transcript_58884/g.149164 Transcript_58884/m.149164 type:complete len:369 (-) Transcript_58884:15-1121(-)